MKIFKKLKKEASKKKIPKSKKALTRGPVID